MQHKSKNSSGIDPWLLGILLMLVSVGFLIFSSASLGLLARTEGDLGASTGKQFAAIVLGGIVAYAVTRVHYRILRQYSLLFLIASMAATALVFVPFIGTSHGGATRWIDIFGVSFQPAELLKIGFVIYYAAFLSAFKDKVATFRFGLLPLLILISLGGALLLSQPDTDTFIILSIALTSMFLVGGGRIKHFFILVLIGTALLFSLIAIHPYIKARVVTFINPASDPQGAGYQLQQSLIAIGSGGFTGRGFGQSVQKFSYLPEPVGDSIFAVAAEEFGFTGATLLIVLFVFFLLKGLRISSHTPDLFGGLLALGIVILIGASAFMNMASMLGVIPLSGLPLSFVSQGGSAMLITLAEAGILLNISRYQRS